MPASKIYWGDAMKSAFVAFVISATLQINTSAYSQKIYLDDGNNVHIVASTGKNELLTRNGRSRNLKVTADGRIAAWLEGDRNIADDNEKDSSRLIVYKNGRKRSIDCQPIIRDFWFWRMGSRIAIDCGGRHFAGREYLYDVDTLKVIDSFDQGLVSMEKRPIWSESSKNFEDK